MNLVLGGNRERVYTSRAMNGIVEVRGNRSVDLEKAIWRLRGVVAIDLRALAHRSKEVTRADRRRAKQRRAALRREEATRKFWVLPRPLPHTAPLAASFESEQSFF